VGSGQVIPCQLRQVSRNAGYPADVMNCVPSRRLPARTATLLAVLAGVVLVALAPAAAAQAASPIGGSRLATSGIVVGAGALSPPPDNASSWLVADLTTGQILAAKDPHGKYRPASTLKTLTALALMPHLDPTAIHTVTATELAPVYGSRVGLVVGGTYTVEQLWYGLLLPSGNDAAAALAGQYGGVSKTIAAMRAVATNLRANDTTVKNESGLDADSQYSSAYDLALFARPALQIPEFRKVTQTTSYAFPGKMQAAGTPRPTYQIFGEDRLLNHGYKGVVGGKTGYTTLAGRTFWVAATQGGHTILVTMMHIGISTEVAAKALLTWGLKNDGRVASVGTLVSAIASPTTRPTSAGENVLTPGTVKAAVPTGTTDSSSPATVAIAVVLGLLAVGVGGWILLTLRRNSSGADPAGQPGPTASGPSTTAASVAGPPTGPVALPVVPPAARQTGSVQVRSANPSATPPPEPDAPAPVPEPAIAPPVTEVVTPPAAPSAARPLPPAIRVVAAPEPEEPTAPPARTKSTPGTPIGNVTVIRPSSPPAE
jgi:D-alanyl-D-alanine carboxypeptidase (penicillin-binding protein 5/6)